MIHLPTEEEATFKELYPDLKYQIVNSGVEHGLASAVREVMRWQISEDIGKNKRVLHVGGNPDARMWSGNGHRFLCPIQDGKDTNRRSGVGGDRVYHTLLQQVSGAYDVLVCMHVYDLTVNDMLGKATKLGAKVVYLVKGW